MPEPAPRSPGGDVVETHISLLVFHEDVVLKYKKPVRLPFVDFRGRAERFRACEAEVACNRRLSPDVYLGVADVRLGDRVLDHAVVLRRLPEDRNLASMVLREDQGLDAHLQRLANLLAEFHSRAERSDEIDAAARPGAIAGLWRAGLDTLRPISGRFADARTLSRIEELSAAYLQGRGPLFDERIARRKVCDGHGDLLATDVFLLDDGPRVLDCVEFDPTLRYVDVLADLAFLLMDLERLGAPAVARTFLAMYSQAAGEAFGDSLVHFYCAQRALVRAEVAGLRAAQSGRDRSPDAESLLALVLAHLEAGRVVLGVVCGLPGTGKSTLASAAGAHLRWPVLRSDAIRRELADPGSSGPLVDRYGEGAYGPVMTERTYSAMFERARSQLERGQSVILDASFTDAGFQRLAEQLAEDTASSLVAVQCRAPSDVAMGRLRSRRAAGTDLSGADEDVARAMGAAADPWPAAGEIDTRRSPEVCVEELVGRLRPPRPMGPELVR